MKKYILLILSLILFSNTYSMQNNCSKLILHNEEEEIFRNVLDFLDISDFVYVMVSLAHNKKLCLLFYGFIKNRKKYRRQEEKCKFIVFPMVLGWFELLRGWNPKFKFELCCCKQDECLPCTVLYCVHDNLSLGLIKNFFEKFNEKQSCLDEHEISNFLYRIDGFCVSAAKRGQLDTFKYLIDVLKTSEVLKMRMSCGCHSLFVEYYDFNKSKEICVCYLDTNMSYFFDHLDLSINGEKSFIGRRGASLLFASYYGHFNIVKCILNSRFLKNSDSVHTMKDLVFYSLKVANKKGHKKIMVYLSWYLIKNFFISFSC